MTACIGAAFQTLQEKVPKLSEGKYCICAEMRSLRVVLRWEIMAQLLLKYPILLFWFCFFFSDQVVESFGEADAFLDTCQLLKGFLWFSAAQLSFKGLHGKVITEGNISDQ